ncbi:hypothetical protein P9D34_09550 [Bacillus swezeyi]|uniref:hypothetical protein n=1 Tax=Bacillus swezeyi TaxID=1925020 RepID=UPI001EFBD7B9|nr:hypothetical protein [Bacillus swezeyi]MEC1260687.1 hypothetical protein [Bacillus swezeyi]MED2928362.1 hypothetical protein [Bacillus swezeyi]MED2942611.1 hypothetical protein [Bacillus swezeyi]MED2963989.1 hypothetical protein [Bacillus swezeyi]MED2978879.1 hypothetical protein [Bacillus swezeyi]
MVDVKIIGIAVLLFVGLMTFSFLLDVFQGMSPSEALHNNLSFGILELGESVVIILYVLIVLAEALENARRKKKRT